jgi:hypothetical protein
MSVEHNKRVAAEFFARFSSSDIAGALATMTDDASWRIPGKPERSPAAGVYDKPRIDALFQRMLARLKNGLTMTVKSSIGEGDHVALEVESHGELTNGRFYDQEYHVLMQFRDGRISAVREYNDTQHANDVWFGPTPSSSD